MTVGGGNHPELDSGSSLLIVQSIQLLIFVDAPPQERWREKEGLRKI